MRYKFKEDELVAICDVPNFIHSIKSHAASELSIYKYGEFFDIVCATDIFWKMDTTTSAMFLELGA